jgi:outer membrane protein assembly factor BamB
MNMPTVDERGRDAAAVLRDRAEQVAAGQPWVAPRPVVAVRRRGGVATVAVAAAALLLAVVVWDGPWAATTPPGVTIAPPLDERDLPAIVDGRDPDGDSTTDDAAETVDPGPPPCPEAFAVEERGSGWELELQDGMITAPVVAGGAVLVGTNQGLGCLLSLDPDTGSLRWSADGEIAPLTLPQEHDGTLLVQLGRWLTAFDAATGERSWREHVRVDDPFTVDDGAIYAAGWVRTGADRFRVLDVHTGEERWRTEDQAWTPVHLRGEEVLVRVRGGYRALDRADGTVLREFEVAGQRHVLDVHGDLLVTLRAPNTTGIVDALTGELVWESNVPGAGNTHPVVVGEQLVVASDAGEAYGIELRTGTYAWRTSIAVHAPRQWQFDASPPPVVDGAVVFGTETGVVAVDAADGRVRWETPLGRARTPVVEHDDGLLVVAGTELVALEADTGEVRWRVEVGEGIDRTLAVSDHAVHLRRGPGGLVTVRRP